MQPALIAKKSDNAWLDDMSEADYEQLAQFGNIYEQPIKFIDLHNWDLLKQMLSPVEVIVYTA